MIVTLNRDVAKLGKAGQPVEVEDADGTKLMKAGAARNSTVAEIRSLDRNLTVDEARKELALGGGFTDRTSVESINGLMPERATYKGAA